MYGHPGFTPDPPCPRCGSTLHLLCSRFPRILPDPPPPPDARMYGVAKWDIWDYLIIPAGIALAISITVAAHMIDNSR